MHFLFLAVRDRLCRARDELVSKNADLERKNAELKASLKVANTAQKSSNLTLLKPTG